MLKNNVLVVIMLSVSVFEKSAHAEEVASLYCSVGTYHHASLAASDDPMKLLVAKTMKVDQNDRLVAKLPYLIRLPDGKTKKFFLEFDVFQIDKKFFMFGGKWRGTMKFINPFTLKQEVIDNRAYTEEQLANHGDGYWAEARRGMLKQPVGTPSVKLFMVSCQGGTALK